MSDDIEDLITVSSPQIRSPNQHNEVIPRFNTRRSNSKCENDSVHADSYVPGQQKIYIKTWGCSHNNSDGEYMAGQLATYGYQITDRVDEADLWLLNSCTVKNPAEDHFYNEIKKAREYNKFIVVAGCVPQGQPRAEYLKGLSVIGVQQIDRVVEVVEETLKGNTVRLFGHKKQDGRKLGGSSLSMPKIRRNPLIEIIAINTGCLNQCSYCKTKHARGELGSYQPDEIVARAKQSFEEGVVEIWLTSEDLGAYGHDIDVTLPQLLWKLLEVIPEYAMMRLGMTNPPYILEHLEEMAKILNHPRVYSFLHVPVQSASDSVLMDMKREYNLADFNRVVDFLKEKVPGVNIATDIICGFPTETDDDFQETMKLVEKYKFSSLFINQFFPRPGTPAAKLQRIPAQEVKIRTREVSKLFQSYHPYSQKMGEVQSVLITEVSHDKQHYVGHNKCYDQVLLPMDENLMGKMVKVHIIETGKHFMKGVILKNGITLQLPKCQPLKKGEISGLSSEKHNNVKNVLFSKLLFWSSVVVLVVSVLLKINSFFSD